ncbi:ubiquitinyl hydrolase 1 [Salvia divinorum]|uniref:Ubiquitin thioesterase OTU n=1 Tax=Salvia divinorum TaxID=28513 RepID=A0ABD1HWS3_SALDI
MNIYRISKLLHQHILAAAPSERLLRHTADRWECCAARSSGAASVWHTILPSYWRTAVLGRHEKHGEGSWNVVWDARPARWLHHAWLLFGAARIDVDLDSNSEVLVARDDSVSKTNNYRVTGVAADGRCLFRAIAHMECLRKGQEAPDEVRQKQLADELRANVVQELLKRRKEIEWFIDEEFEMYVKRIEKPYIWGGEPELLMCSHILRAPIRVFMKDKGSDSNLIKVATYGDDYTKDEEEDNSINVLFHGYGHYDVLHHLES